MGKVINYDGILYPEEVLSDNKEKLISLYLNDYGKEKERIIRRKLNNTCYIFDSNPIDTFRFYKDNSNKIFNLKDIFRIEKEYRQYIKLKRKIDITLRDKFLSYLSGVFNTYPSYLDNEVLNFDYESFSFDVIKKLNNPNLDDELRIELENRQKNYINSCSLYGLKPVTDIGVIDKIIKYKNELQLLEYEFLFENSIWGKRIYRNIFEKTGIAVNKKALASILYSNDSCANVSLIPSSDGKSFVRVCYIPLMKDYYISNLDRTFLHEARHIVESGVHIIGLNNLSNNRYMYIDEVKTEKNAIRDCNNLGDTLFSNVDGSALSAYEALFPYSDDFIEEHLSDLNKLSIDNNIVLLEEMFGKEDLILFDDSLRDILENFSENSNFIVDKNNQKRLIKNLNDNYSCRH